MVDKKKPRINSICPNGHQVITRKAKNIQCRICVEKGIYSRFDLPELVTTE